MRGPGAQPGWRVQGWRSPPQKKKYIFFLILFFVQNFNFFFNFWNLHERFEIGRRKRKTEFQIFLIFVFWVMAILGHFCDIIIHHPNFRGNFAITRKIIIGEFFYYSLHSSSFIMFPPLLRMGGGFCISLSGKKPGFIHLPGFTGFKRVLKNKIVLLKRGSLDWVTAFCYSIVPNPIFLHSAFPDQT